MAAIYAHTLPVDSSYKHMLFTALQVVGASLFLALCAQISIPLHFSPVPLTGQTFGMMLVGAALGSRKGALSVLTYIAQGALGLPVFAGGHFGLMSLVGPTGGYFLGFVVQAYLVGYFMERQTAFHTTKTLAVLLISCLLQLGLGVLWLSSFVGFSSALTMGMYPFLLGEAAKSIFITAYLRSQSTHEKNSDL